MSNTTAECMKCEKPIPNHKPEYAEICEDCAETHPVSNYLADDYSKAVEQAYGVGGLKR